jgi:hypothetical protein
MGTASVSLQGCPAAGQAAVLSRGGARLGLGGRARVAHSREWCGTEPGADAIGHVVRAVRAFGGGRASRSGRAVIGKDRWQDPFGM